MVKRMRENLRGSRLWAAKKKAKNRRAWGGNERDKGKEGQPALWELFGEDQAHPRGLAQKEEGRKRGDAWMNLEKKMTGFPGHNTRRISLSPSTFVKRGRTQDSVLVECGGKKEKEERERFSIWS